MLQSLVVSNGSGSAQSSLLSASKVTACLCVVSSIAEVAVCFKAFQAVRFQLHSQCGFAFAAVDTSRCRTGRRRFTLVFVD